MAQRTTFAKLQRERAKKQRAEEKRARKQGLPAPGTTQTSFSPPPTRKLGVPDVEGDGRPLHPDELLRLVEQLSAAHDAGLIDDDELEEKRATLMARI
ncbi:MAG: hypothetical protein AAGA99_17905 [Actinomycetota bacterium]|jgi:hypothetical protein